SNHNAVRDGADTGWGMFLVQSGSGSGTLASGVMNQSASSVIPAPAIPVSVDDPTVAYNKVLARGGALPWARDPVDARDANNISTNTGAIINSQTDVGGWPAIVQYTRAASWDSDGDGMPDWWEMDRGSNPLVADNNVLAPSGYTQLENYLNYITSASNWGVDANGN